MLFFILAQTGLVEIQKEAYETRNRPKKWHDVVAEHNGAFDVEIIGRYYNDRRAYECEMILMAYYQDKHNW